MYKTPADYSGIEIAIIGLACRAPRARTFEEYWKNVKNAEECTTQYTRNELLQAGVTEQILSDPNYVSVGAPLPDMEMFDNSFFGVNQQEAAVMDPQHRHFLETSWEAFENAGYNPQTFQGSIGVFAGCGEGAYFRENVLSHKELLDEMGFFLLRHNGNDKDFLATRVSYELNLRGPSLSIQTACSTSLVAIHYACQSLLNGECEIALAGGVTVEQPHNQGYLYKDKEIYAKDGRCRPYSQDSTGTIFSSAVGVVILKRFEDAQRDGDHIHAVIRGSAVNNDGAGKVGYYAPSVAAQARVIKEALSVAGIEPDSVGLVEGHGTGTALGDPIEVEALTQAYHTPTGRMQYCALGSVKGNIGHSDTAAGVLSLLKVVGALKDQVIPASLHAETTNPLCNFETSPFYVPTETKTWSANVRRAGVTSLGVGGTNVHAILEQAPEFEQPAAPDTIKDELFLVSAQTETVLERLLDRYGRRVKTLPAQQFEQIAYTLGKGRKHFEQRAAVVAGSLSELVDSIETRADDNLLLRGSTNSKPKIVFLFAGGGAQKAGVGRELYKTEAVFKAEFDECNKINQMLGGVNLLPYLESDQAVSDFEKAELALPLLFSIQYALARLLISNGVTPAALLGHSLGEYTAACLAEVLTLEDALKIVLLRAKLFGKVPAGGMRSIALSEQAIQPYLSEQLSLAAVNAAELVVISGSDQALLQLDHELAQKGIESRVVPIKVPAHSHLLDPILDEFERELQKIKFGVARFPLISNRLGKFVSEVEIGKSRYWREHLRHAVRFSDGINACAEMGEVVFLEVGPGKTLTSLARLARNVTARDYICTLLANEGHSERRCYLRALAQLYTTGVDVDRSSSISAERRFRLPLPTYPFVRKSFWIAANTDAVQTRTIQQYTPGWLPVAFPHSPAPAAAAEALVIFQSTRNPVNLTGLLAANSQQKILTVQRGGDYAFDGSQWQIDPQSAEHYTRLLNDLQELPFSGVTFIFCWSFDDGDQSAELPESYAALFRLGQALSASSSSKSVKLLYLSDNLYGLGARAAGSPEQVLSANLASTLAHEVEGLKVRIVDLAGAANSRELLQRALAEISSAHGNEEVVVLTEQARLCRCYQPLPDNSAAEAWSRLRTAGVYLITGGLGGLGFELARQLAERKQAQLVLMSRQINTDSALVQSRVRQLEELGAQVLLVKADVCQIGDLELAAQTISSRFGILNGIFHTAGILDDNLLVNKSLEQCWSVLAPKVQGVQNLEKVFAKTELDCFVLYSSISALLTTAGQSDYSAANAFLDLYAQRAQAEGRTYVQSINWSAFTDVGMAAQLDRLGQVEKVAENKTELQQIVGTVSQRNFFWDLQGKHSWITNEHKLNHHTPVLPGTGYLSLAAEIGNTIFGSTHALLIKDLYFNAPFIVAGDSATRLYGITQKQSLNVSRDVYKIDFLGGAAGLQEYATGTLESFESENSRVPGATAIRAEFTQALESRQLDTKLDQSKWVAFGSHWQCVQAATYVGSIVKLDLQSTAENADFILQPALLDVAISGSLKGIPSYDPEKHFYVPVSLAELQIYKKLTDKLTSYIKYTGAGDLGTEYAIFSVELYSDSGELVAIVRDLVLHLTSPDNVLQVKPKRSRIMLPNAERSNARDGHSALSLTPVEGQLALGMILGATERYAQTIVSKQTPAILKQQFNVVRSAQQISQQPLPYLELSRVEERLRAHPALADLAVTGKFDRFGDLRVVAYVVRAVQAHFTVSELRGFLQDSVEERYMPLFFVEVPGIPRLDDGALQLSELPDPLGSEQSSPPQGELEQYVARLWRELTGFPEISRFDTFIDIGGHSLLAIRFIQRVKRERGIELDAGAFVVQSLQQVANDLKVSVSASDTGTGSLLKSLGRVFRGEKR